jgi:hypothetical protein
MCRVKLDPDAEDVLLAITALLPRCGATDFAFGVDEDLPSDEAGWWAYAVFPGGARIGVVNEAGPVEAFHALAGRVLDGGMCTTCKRLVTTSDEGIRVRATVNIVDGSEMSQEQAAAHVRRNGACHWRRDGSRWYSGCDPHLRPKPIPPEGDDEIHSTEKLAQALSAVDDPAMYYMVDRARSGYYHSFLSPHALPELELVKDLRELGHLELVARVLDDEFDETMAESDAWSRSEDGQETVSELRASGMYADAKGAMTAFMETWTNLSPGQRAEVERRARSDAFKYTGVDSVLDTENSTVDKDTVDKDKERRRDRTRRTRKTKRQQRKRRK